ncbi:hypothetical protein BSL82_10105 [Tardibacter chloracetimidivorans]|uniref:Uncharacterized protein n=1 Tax=Tardibacter chloracetimidivorans TaxID=1921510 RepID=A0A1L3ZVE5_9SPHN|nr:hypothetical protein [Tardibacter chloracetimidivorans]API59626.1 hypothetical protein BSL82_10105 [Tardibacter chloracetimidivorans]
MATPKSPRERAARALCRKDGHPENIMFEGRPMWESYLDVVDVVLEAAAEPGAMSAEEVREVAANIAAQWKSSLRPGTEARLLGHQEAARWIAAAIRAMPLTK